MKKMLVVVPDGSEEMEVAAFVEIPNWTKVVGTEIIEVTVAGWTDKIKLFHGMTIIPDIHIDEVNMEDYDALAIPGGWPGTQYFTQSQSERMLSMIKWMHAQKRIIATMCFGIMAVGEAGLLAGVKATCFGNDCCEMCKTVKETVRGYGTDFQDKAVVVDRNILSNLGPAVADEAALQLVELLIGEAAAAKIAANLMYGCVTPEELRWTQPIPKETREPGKTASCCGCSV